MAFMSQEKKAKIAAALKPVMPKDWKYTLRVHHHSEIILTIDAAPVDLFNLHAQKDQWRDGYIQLNQYYLENQYTGEVLKVLLAAKDALNTDNFDKSDIQTDYFHVGHHVSMHIGRWNKPFTLTSAPASAPVPEQKPEPTYDEMKARVEKLEKELGLPSTVTV